MCQDFPSNVICFWINNSDAIEAYFFNNIWGGIIASFIFGILTSTLPKIRRWLHGRRFKKIVGFSHMDGDYPLACGKMYSQIYTGCNFIKPKTAAQFRVSSMVSNTDIVAYDYLKNVFFNELGVNVKACLDEDMLCPKSYCSFGYFNNVLSLKILCDKKNTFYHFNGGFVNQRTKVSFRCGGMKDYGVIVKITDEITDSVQICIAGLGESGTTGAAYFFANRWKELEKKFGKADFGCVIEVSNLYDPSAKMVDSVS